MKPVMMLVAMLAFARAAAGQNADDYRGGWRTDSGEAHTYEFSIRGATVRGIYCTYCADATTLAFVDGTFGPDGHQVRSDSCEGGRQHGVQGQGGREVQPGPPDRDRHERRARRRHVRTRPDQGSARTGSDPGDGVRAPEEPSIRCRETSVAGTPTARTACPTFSRVRGKRQLTEKDVIGVWLGFGVGAPKQYFIIKKVGDKLRGMVCGTCDNPYTMAALDDFRIEGDTLRFNILHEDWADGELPTFDKHVTAHVGWNEMRCTTAADHQPPPPPRLAARASCPASRCRGRFRLRPRRATPGLNGRRRTRRRRASASAPRSRDVRLRATGRRRAHDRS